MKTQKDLSAAFWGDNASASRKRIPNYSGNGFMFCTDTRVAFCDYVDALQKNGVISQALAQRATLKNPPRKFHINRFGQGQRETVDEFDTRKEARAMLSEYQMSDPSAQHYLSSRPCATWEN